MYILFAVGLGASFCNLIAAYGSQTPLSNSINYDFSSKDRSSAVSQQDGLQQGKGQRALQDMLSAIDTMQDTYFDVYGGTWPKAIDWTAAVMGTHISATLSSLVVGLDKREQEEDKHMSCMNRLGWENVVNKYFTQTALFYFGENAFALRNQAYDDMLWVVLGWLENIKFARMNSMRHWRRGDRPWHGVQLTTSAAHRARIFYDLASKGWTTNLCGGGMIWNPNLTPYKNAITNELFAAASISMYLYFPGDNNTSPFVANAERGRQPGKAHDSLYLENAIKAYKWLQESGMQSSAGLYQDGFHVSGWTRFRNGTIDPGTRKCDALNTMVYTYNQGVMLSASRGLWLATGSASYLDDGHYLVGSVINATTSSEGGRNWNGLGRGGILEDFCDHEGYCSQDGQTFKGIFFHHLAEFCRPLWPQEEDFLAASTSLAGFDKDLYQSHLDRCASYARWIKYNARAALRTRNEEGLFGMWWGMSPKHDRTSDGNMHDQTLPPGADDHLNPHTPGASDFKSQDVNERGRGRTVETQSGGLAVLRAQWQWESQF